MMYKSLRHDVSSGCAASGAVVYDGYLLRFHGRQSLPSHNEKVDVISPMNFRNAIKLY